ncbi:biopolymer transporter ExbD [Mameliella alba]|nr:biopolymer transporter ExbD [Mameliella alba]MBY6171854.1 biopolymer transporter ExbD [Mameliella alba]MBY6175982.1 biopolymer transporter ExbD [Mameliella alba]
MTRVSRRRSNREPTIALINIVFLMLIFFLVAGTLARPLDKGLTLVRTAALEGAPPQDAFVIHADGRIAWQGAAVAGPAEAVALLSVDAREIVRVVPDRALPAEELIRIGRALRLAGAGKVVIVTERGLE